MFLFAATLWEGVEIRCLDVTAVKGGRFNDCILLLSIEDEHETQSLDEPVTWTNQADPRRRKAEGGVSASTTERTAL
jgi:hypothetical protein